MNLKNLSLKIRRRKTPFFNRLFILLKWIRSLSVPCIKPVHSLLYNEWAIRTSLWHNFWRIVYYEPMFKSQCEKIGKGFIMEYAGNGISRILGTIKIFIGENVHIFDNTSFTGLKVLDNPELHIGDNTYIGPSVRIMVGRKIEIGKYCMITSKLITDNPGHSIYDVSSRMESGGGSPDAKNMHPIKIGDFCFLSSQSFVYPGVTIGDGVVAKIGSHITQDIPSFCQVAGNPARIIRKLPIPEEIAGIVGRERYEGYLEAHRKLKIHE